MPPIRSGSGFQEYVVRPGDTLSGIAQRLSVSLEALLR
ncbi:MAG: LysM peptidoglycan-binding domain-containing protein, partial [Acidobacteria bacterium]|nr:LysM peptidoglycan-binding domain-containing protein [Acidobacteriota bacterium]MDW7985498.1 LysM domain-containing protein [Acidobacteriota bacterium]